LKLSAICNYNAPETPLNMLFTGWSEIKWHF